MRDMFPPLSYHQTLRRLGRNKRCFCGSGKKFKHCCMPIEEVPAKNELEELEAVEEARGPVARAALESMIARSDPQPK